MNLAIMPQIESKGAVNLKLQKFSFVILRLNCMCPICAQIYYPCQKLPKMILIMFSWKMKPSLYNNQIVKLSSQRNTRKFSFYKVATTL